MAAQFDFDALLAAPLREMLQRAAENDDTISSIVVFDIPEAIELCDLHIDLTKHFSQCAPAIRVNVQAASLLKETSLQECRVSFSPIVNRDIGELAVHQALEKQCRRLGINFAESDMRLECR